MSWDILTFAGEVLRRFGYLFYIMNPSAHNYEKLSDVKDYYNEVTPIFIISTIMEQIVRYLQNKPLWRYNSTISTTCQGILMEISKIPCRGVEVLVYAWIYKNYRLFELPWDSAWTWIFCWLAHDFFYYWMHRMSHQVNIFWAIHETHHAPETMILPSALQSHVFLLPIHWLTYLPMALGIPPTTYYVHYQINIIYQFWLHSEIVDKMPAFIEYLFVTPSHHRAHHGRNRRYIDKNFGGFLMVWDRLFGTYEPETQEDKPLYGVTKQMNSFNAFYVQTRQFRTIWKNFREYKSIGHKLSAIFKGPGWSPGKPWIGTLEDIPDPVPKFEVYDPKLPTWCMRYMQLHFTIFLNNYMLFALNLWMLSKMTVFAACVYCTFCAVAFGFTLDKSPYTVFFEIMRSVLYFVVEKIAYQEILAYGSPFVFTIIYINRIVFSCSAFLWIFLLLFEQVRKVYKASI